MHAVQEAVQQKLISPFFPESHASFVVLPGELVAQIFNALGTNDILRCGRLSMEMRLLAIKAIAQHAPLMSRVVTKFFKHKNEGALQSFLDTATSAVAKEAVPPFELRLDPTRFWSRTAVAMDLLASTFPTFHKVTITNTKLSGILNPFSYKYPIFPSSIREITIKTVYCKGLQVALQRATELRSLRIRTIFGKDGFELVGMELPQSLQILECPPFHFHLPTHIISVVDPYLMSKIVPFHALQHLETSVAARPQFVSAKWELALRVEDLGRKRELLQEVVKIRPDHAPAHIELALSYQKEGTKAKEDEAYHFTRARELALKNHDVEMLSEIAYHSKDAALAMRAFRMINWGSKFLHFKKPLRYIAETIEEGPDAVLVHATWGRSFPEKNMHWCIKNRYWPGLCIMYKKERHNVEIEDIFCATFGEDKMSLLQGLRSFRHRTKYLCELHEFFWSQGIQIDDCLRAEIYMQIGDPEEDYLNPIETYLSKCPSTELTREFYVLQQSADRFRYVRKKLLANKEDLSAVQYEQHVLKNMIRRTLASKECIRVDRVRDMWELLVSLDIFPEERKLLQETFQEARI